MSAFDPSTWKDGRSVTVPSTSSRAERVAWRRAAEAFNEEYGTAYGPKAYRRRTQRWAIDLYGALLTVTAGSATPEVPPSLATCEQLPKADAVSGFSDRSLRPPLREHERDLLPLAFRLGIEDVDRAARFVQVSADMGEVLGFALERDDPDRVEKVIELVDAGEVAHARRLAACGRQSVQLECPEMAGGCGHEENYLPVTCDSPLCPDCAKRTIGQAVERYLPAVRSWTNPTFHTYTIENVPEAATGEEAVKGAFGRFRRRTVPPSGSTERKGAVKRWRWGVSGEPADEWKPSLRGQGHGDLARRLQKRYVEQGRNIPLDELLRTGFYAVDVKQVGPDEFNVHLHVLADMPYVPQAALSAVWEDVSGSPVMDVRSVYGRDVDDLEAALVETIGYAAKPPEFEDVGSAVEYVTETKGSRMIQPFGALHGNTPDLSGCLLCSECELTPAWWEYRGVTSDRIDNMGTTHDGESTGSDPPEGSA